MLRLALFAVLLTACTVTRPGVGDQPFRCGTDADCVDGYDCVDGSMLGLPGFCAPSCDPRRATETCPTGHCTPDGACLAQCSPNRDGSLRVACPSGLSCIRSDLFRDEGLCWDLPGCSVGTDCEGEHVPSSCLSEVIGVPALVDGLEIASNRLYCIAAPQGPLGDRCPEGSIPIPAQGDYPGACLPTCNDPADVCPPGMACWRELGWLFGSPRQSVCWIGTWGSVCRSDADCLFGRCFDVGGRSVCTERCTDVPLGEGGCGALSAVQFYAPGSTEWSCRSSLGESVCVPEGAIGAPCGAGLACLDALRCFPLRDEVTGVCSRVCNDDEDCYLPEVTGPRREQVYCSREFQVCLPQGGGAAPCESDRECLSGRCVAMRCTSPNPT